MFHTFPDAALSTPLSGNGSAVFLFSEPLKLTLERRRIQYDFCY